MSSHIHELELRDPTREELYNGPKREKLPVEIQQLSNEETACTFCGVSYFVFSEVQELQATVKKYKKRFHEFVRFMERERKISQELKTEVAIFKKHFNQSAATFSSHAIQLANETTRLRQRDVEMIMHLQVSRDELSRSQNEYSQLQTQFRRAEDDWKLASTLTEQKLRNEILHLSSQIEKCKLQSSAQEAELTAELERERTKIREMEVVLVNARASMSSMERQIITERDQLKQQLLGATERIELERETAKQLEVQLRAVQQELTRIVTANESDRQTNTQLQTDIAGLKQQLQSCEKQNGALRTERDEAQAESGLSNDLIRSLRAQIATLEKKIQENLAAMEKLKQEYAKDLEKMRLEHGSTINRLQRDHQKALDDLQTQQKTYLEYLQKQTSDMQQGTDATQHALLEMERKWTEAERQLIHWKREAERHKDELQDLRSMQVQHKTCIATLERKMVVLEEEKRDLEEEAAHLQRQLDQSEAKTKVKLEQIQTESKARCQQLEHHNQQLERRIDTTQRKYDQLERSYEQLKQAKTTEEGEPQVAWVDGRNSPSNSTKVSNSSNPNRNRHSLPPSNNNQENHELEKVVESLRQTLAQKDKEIALLQQTVHRECLERTSLLERMRSGKILPDLGPAAVLPSSSDGFADHRSTSGKESVAHSDENDEDRGDQPKASFYERLRRTGQRKSKPRKT